MTTTEQSKRRMRLLSAVTVLGVSVGATLAAAPATGAVDAFVKQDSQQHKTGSQQLKLDSTERKAGGNQLKLDSQQNKTGSQQLKLDDTQRKAGGNQLKLDSTHAKPGTHQLNPQPLPPG